MMTQKQTQLLVNEEVRETFAKAIEEIDHTVDHKDGKRLRSCTAWVYETENYYFLRSYNTVIAFIDKRTDVLYDALRMVYGYTSTSAQHIAKFSKDYGHGKYGCGYRMSYRTV